MKWMKNSFLVLIIAVTFSLLADGDCREQTMHVFYKEYESAASSGAAAQCPVYEAEFNCDFSSPQTTYTESQDFVTGADVGKEYTFKADMCDRSQVQELAEQQGLNNTFAKDVYKFDKGIETEPTELITSYTALCHFHANEGEHLLRQVETAHDHKDLEQIMTKAEDGLREVERNRNAFNERCGYFDGKTELEDKTIESFHAIIEKCETKWEKAVKDEAHHWIDDFDKKVARGDSVGEKIKDCIKDFAKEEKPFRKAVYECKLEHVKEQQLKDYFQHVSHLSPEKLQKEHAASRGQQAGFEKRMREHTHTHKKYDKKTCSELKSLEFCADRERRKQQTLQDLIAKKTAATKPVANSVTTQPSSPATPSAEKTRVALSDRAQSYVQTNGLTENTVNKLGAENIDRLAGVALEIDKHPDLAALKKDLENSGINPLDMVTTGQPGMGEEGRCDTGLRDGVLDLGHTLVGGAENGLKQFGDSAQNAGNIVVRGTGKGIDQFSTMNKDTMFFVMDFLDHPGQVSQNVAENVASGASHFASQFKGDNVRLNEMLANEPQNVKDYYHNLVTVLEKGSMGSMSSKTIETIAGTKLCVDRIPGNVCKHFIGLSAEDKFACATSGGLSLLLPGAAVAQAGEAIQAAKLTAAVAGNALKEGAVKVATTVGRAGEVLTGAAEGLGSQEGALAGAGGMRVPANVMSEAEKVAAVGNIKSSIVTSGEAGARSGVPNSVLRQGEVAGAKTNIVSKEITFFDNNIQHIFREASGHLIDSPENRKLIIEVVKDQNNYLGLDKRGNSWFGKTLEDGKQVWASVRDGQIRDAGLNCERKIFDNQTGLCAPMVQKKG